jgi:hypothetical protein
VLRGLDRVLAGAGADVDEQAGLVEVFELGLDRVA